MPEMFLLCVSWRNARNLWIQERQPRFVWFCLMMVLLLLRLGMVNGFQSLFSSCHRRIKLPQVAVVGLKSSSSQWLDEFLDTIIHKNNSTAITPRATSLEKQKFESKGNDASLGWRRMVWGTESTVPPAAEILPSPVDIAVIRDRVVFIKRDDQLRLPGSQINGNKARKMLALQQIDPLSFPSCIVSYGGPQSNSMLALAAVVQYQNTLIENMQSTPGHLRKLFVYYTKTLPRFLRNQPSGNLFRAQALGMELVEVSSDVYHSLFGNAESGVVGTTPPPTLEPLVLGDSVWIPQGGACAMALTGARVLAREILDFWIGQSSTTTLGSNGATTSSQPLSVCIPGGTCSTAALVHVALKEMQADTPPHVKKLDIEVVVIPCVGDEAYARRQMMNLQLHVFGPETTQKYGIPTILQPHPKKSILQSTIVPATELDYFRFGEPDPLILNTFREFRNDYDIVLDLLYGSPAWTIMLRHWTSYSTIDCGSVESKRETFDPDAPLDGRRIMYVHSGGLEGINSQLLRYKYKNLVDSDEIQLPGRRSNVVKNPSD